MTAATRPNAQLVATTTVEERAAYCAGILLAVKRLRNSQDTHKALGDLTVAMLIGGLATELEREAERVAETVRSASR